jgi:GntR family transcriptional regulator
VTEPFRPILRDANARMSRELREAGASIWSADLGDDRELEVVDTSVDYDLEAPDGIERALGSIDILIRDRVYVVDGRRVCWARSYLDANLTAGTRIEHPDPGPGGVPARLAELGFELASFVEDLEIVEPGDVEDEEHVKLGVGDGACVARIMRLNFAAAGRLVEVTDMRLVASAYRFRWAFTS